MPKYKYVDGVKYRVVPQSVLGYALVREGSDNSLPTGGTDGQVLAKASDADFDVEWASIPEGAVFVELNPVDDPSMEVPAGSRVYSCTYTAEELKQLIDGEKIVYLTTTPPEGTIVLGKSYIPLLGYMATPTLTRFAAATIDKSSGSVFGSFLEGGERNGTVYFVASQDMLETASENVPSSFVIAARASTVDGATQLTLRYPEELDNYVDKALLGNYALLSFYDDGTRGYSSTPGTVYLPVTVFDNNDLILYFGDRQISLNLNTGVITINHT